MNMNDFPKGMSLNDTGFRLPDGFRAVSGDGQYRPGTRKIELAYEGSQSAGQAIKALFAAYSKDGVKMVGTVPGQNFVASWDYPYSRD